MHWSGSLVFHWVHLTFLFNITFLAAILPSSMLLTLLGDMDNKFDSSLIKALHYPDIWNNLFTWHLGGTTSVQTLVMVTLYQSCTSPATKTKCELRRWYWWPCEVGGWGAPCFGGRTISFLVKFESASCFVHFCPVQFWPSSGGYPLDGQNPLKRFWKVT